MLTSNEAILRLAVPADAPAIAQVRVDAWRSTYRGMIPAAYLAAMKVEESAALWERVLTAAPNTTSTFVAVADGAVVGFASGLMLVELKHGLDAELSAIYLRKDRQREGLGTRLLLAVSEAQRRHGATGLLTWVIAENRGARAFYERLGAELLIEQPFQWDGMDLVEAGYGWRDLDALAAACAAANTAT
jgi:GNAT superfamily N-acetyltransferase